MIKVNYRNNLNRVTEIIDEATRITEFLEDNDLGYEGGTLSLNGSTLMPGDLYKSFEELGVTDSCFLMEVVKMNNAC